MKRSTMELLCCPNCHAALSLRDERGDGSVDEGSLFCSPCERSYPIRHGVAHFLSPQDLEGPNRRFARFYDWVSHVYTLSTRVAFLAMGGERQARMEILDRLELNGGRVLEVSIGTGVNLPYLFESPGVGEVYGLDVSAGQLARCRRLVTQRGWSVDLFLGMAEALPFQPGAFDSVFHIGGINFFSGKQQAIEEMIRVARPGSRIIIADETERVAQLYDQLPGFPRSHRGQKIEVAVPVHLLPDTMEEVRVDDIWEAHGQPHGYCLEFRKPA